MMHNLKLSQINYLCNLFVSYASNTISSELFFVVTLVNYFFERGYIMKSKLLSILLLVVGIFISNNVYAGSVAREIAGIAPDDSVFYIAGSGSDKLADDFNQTVLNDLITDPSVESFVEQVKAAIIPQIDLDNDFIEGVEFVKDIIEQTRILKDPVLAGAVVNKFDPKNEQIEGYLYVVSTGGKAKVEIFKDTIISSFEKYDMADELEVEIEKVRSVGKVIKFSKKDDGEEDEEDADEDADENDDEECDDDEPMFCLTNIGDYMIFIVTVEGQEDAYLQKLAANIKAGPKPLNVFEGAEFDNDGIIAVYNYESYFNMIEQMVDAGGDEGKAFKNMFEKMNLKELGTLYYRISFKGKQMVLDVYGDQLGGSVFAGFFSQVDTKMLKAVPVDATGFSIFNYSFEKLFNMYYDMIAAIDENAIAELENGFNEFQDELGVNLGDGFLHNITGEVLVSFKSNAATGMMGSSSSCLMTVKDADLFAETIDQLVGFAKDELEGSPFPIKYNVNEQEGKQFRSIVVPQLAMFGLQPTIVKLDDEHIVISSSSLAASETVRLWAADGIENSILANPKYQKAVTDAPGELYSLQYTDSENSSKGHVYDNECLLAYVNYGRCPERYYPAAYAAAG